MKSRLKSPPQKRGTPYMNILNSIETHRYAATDMQVETLANARYACGQQTTNIDGTYLRVLVAGCQAELGDRKARKPGVDVQRAAIERINARFYAAVLRGVTTADVAPDPAATPAEQTRRSIERNRRSVFARTAKATLVAFAGAGGDIRTLKVKAVSKSALRAYTAGKTPAQANADVALGRAQETVLRLIREESDANPKAAREHLAALIDALCLQLETLPMPRTVRRLPTLVATRPNA